MAKLCCWPRNQQSYVAFRGKERVQKATMLAWIQRRILHQGSLVHKTIRVGLDLYDDSDTCKEEETVLNWILCSFRSDEWSEGYEKELNQQPGM